MEGIKIKSLFSATVLILLVCLTIESAYAEEATTQSVANSSKIALKEFSYNFGTVTEGSTVEHEFKFKNEGSGNLIIQRVVPSCGCTAAAASADPIAPGAESTIKASLDTSGMDGRRTKTIQVYTNDPDKTTLELTLEGVIQRDVQINPSQLTFGDITKGEEKSGKFEVAIRSDSGVSLKSAQSFSKLINVKEVQAEGSAKVFSVTLSRDLPIGPFRDRIIINTVGKDGKERPINLPVFADVTGSVKLTPSNVSFGIIEGQQPLTRSVKLESSGKTPLSILGAESRNEAVAVEVKEIAKGKTYVVKLTLDPSKVSKDLRTSIVIQTNIEESKELTLNVYGVRSATSNG